MNTWKRALLVVMVIFSIEDTVVVVKGERQMESGCTKLCKKSPALTEERFTRVWAVPSTNTSRARLTLCWRKNETSTDLCTCFIRKYELTFEGALPVLLEVLKVESFLVLTENGSLVQKGSEEKMLRTKDCQVLDFSVKDSENVCWFAGECTFADHSDNGNKTLPDLPGDSGSEEEKQPGANDDRGLNWVVWVGFVAVLVLLLLCIEVRFRVVWKKLKKMYEDLRSGEESSIGRFSGRTTMTDAFTFSPPSGVSGASKSLHKERPSRTNQKWPSTSAFLKRHGGDTNSQLPFPRFILPGMLRHATEESDEEHEYEYVDSECLRDTMKNPIPFCPFNGNKKNITDGDTLPLDRHDSINSIYNFGRAREVTPEAATDEKVLHFNNGNLSLDRHESVNSIYSLGCAGAATPEAATAEKEEALQFNSSCENGSDCEGPNMSEKRDTSVPLDQAGGPEEPAGMHLAIQNISRRSDRTISLPADIGTRNPFISLDGS